MYTLSPVFIINVYGCGCLFTALLLTKLWGVELLRFIFGVRALCNSCLLSVEQVQFAMVVVYVKPSFTCIYNVYYTVVYMNCSVDWCAFC